MSYIGQSLGAGVRNRYYYTATGGETSLSGADDNGKTLRFADGNYVDVMLNGITLVAGTDYDTNTADTISGLAALTASDVVEIVVYDVFSVADSVSKSDGGTFEGPVTFADATTHQGAATFASTTTHQGVATFQAAAVLNAGTTAERPASPATGSVRYNTTLELYEGYNGKEWTALSATKTPDVYTIDNSLRFNDDDSAYLARTPSVAGDRKTWTWSAWVKRGNLSQLHNIYSQTGGGATSQRAYFLLTSSNDLLVAQYNGSSLDYQVQTSQLFRDPSAWYHFVIAFDSTKATASDRIKIYINGNQVSAFSTASYPALNHDSYINTTNEANIGQDTKVASRFFDGYMSDVYFIDGEALDPTSFGEFDANGVWNPIAFAGSYGTNGFHLDFADNSTAAALGTDTSGNGNDWTPSGIVASDQMTDTPSVNYATLNSIDKDDNATLSEGNLKVASNGAGNSPATFFLTSGKWYWEAQGTGYAVGVAGEAGKNYTGTISSTGSKSIGYWEAGGVYWDGGSSTGLATYTASDTVAVALDMDAGTVRFYKNNTLIYTATFGSGTVPDLSAGVFPVHNNGNTTARTVVYNFGQRPFAYTPPTGFVALSSSNLPTPTIADGSDHFEPVLYTGNGATLDVAVSHDPDFVWVKERDTTEWHQLYDALRGTGALFSNDSSVESAIGGISLGTGNFTASDTARTNQAGEAYVAWSWNAGGSTVTNNDGTRTAQVRANTDAGFSIVSYNPALTSGQSCTVGHGLSQAPEIIISKSRSHVYNWWTYTTIIDGSVDYLALNLTNAAVNDAHSLAITNSTFTQDQAYTGSSSSHISYCFHSVDGFSKFGTYTGNGSTDGPFVYTGFRPAFVMFKRTDATGNWAMLDSYRNAYNIVDERLFADLSDAASTLFGVCDFTSNGFKFRTNAGSTNASGGTYIYMAFAENPFKTARAR